MRGFISSSDILTDFFTFGSMVIKSKKDDFDVDDPCQCLDNATIFDVDAGTGGDDGQFSEVVSITSGSGAPLPNGMTWSIVGATGAFDENNIPAIGMQDDVMYYDRRKEQFCYSDKTYSALIASIII